MYILYRRCLLDPPQSDKIDAGRRYEMKLSLSENIGSLRRASGLTQERLAEALGVSFAAVSKWERGVHLDKDTTSIPR